VVDGLEAARREAARHSQLTRGLMPRAASLYRRCMCEWSAPELLRGWSQRSARALGRLGAVELHTLDDGEQAILEVRGVGSFTAWSSGLLELAFRNEVLTEQRHGVGAAEAVLDGWLTQLAR
jgi:hypothetical protein